VVFIFVGNSRAAVAVNFIAAAVFLALAFWKRSFAWFGTAAAICVVLGLISLAMVRMSERRRSSEAPERLDCASCTHVNQPGWRYCSRCGAPRQVI